MEQKQKSPIGRNGEAVAREYLAGQGFTICTTNYQTRTGEIDIVARDGTELVFIEVKTAVSDRFGDPADWVTPAKQRKLYRTAEYYILEHPDDSVTAFRFDVIGVTVRGGDRSIEHIRDAFSG